MRVRVLRRTLLQTGNGTALECNRTGTVDKVTKAKCARNSYLFDDLRSPSLGCDAVGDVQDDSTETEEAEALAGVR